MMTKKDYIKFAEMIRSWSDPKVYPISARQLTVPITFVATEIAHIFKEGNPRFDFDKFFEACV